jgi:hypothetical protein
MLATLGQLRPQLVGTDANSSLQLHHSRDMPMNQVFNCFAQTASTDDP